MVFMKRLFLTFFLFFSGIIASGFESGDVRYEQKDVENFGEVMNFIGRDSSLPMSELVIKVARHLIGTPYVASTIEIQPEKLTVNTRQTDCILFVEMCVALSLVAKSDSPTFDKYADCLRSFRYRDGIVDGYASRLHYTSDWIAQGVKAGIFREVSSEIGGVPLKQRFSFMTSHPELYMQLKDDPGLQILILNAEDELGLSDYWYIPKTDIPNHIDYIKDGDIVCFTDSTPGLDIAHVAFALWQDGQLHFIHASSKEKEVVISSSTLVDYTNSIKSHSGIRIVRLLD